MKRIFLTLNFLVVASCAFAQTGARYVTLASPSGQSVYELKQDEVAELISAGSVDLAVSCVSVEVGSASFPMHPASIATRSGPGVGTVVAGPASIRFFGGDSGCATLKITPNVFDVTRTVVIPPGTNQIMVTFESSTNLIHWSAVTNGIYGSPDEARFFRVQMSSPSKQSRH